MSDAQFTALLAVIGSGMAGIVAVIKWAVGRLTKAIDDNSTAMLDNTKSNAILSTKIDAIDIHVRKTTPALGVRAPTNPVVIGE